MHTGTITPESRIPAAERPRLGILYPRGGSAFEYYRFAEHFSDNIRCYLIGGMHAFGGDRTHDPDPLRAIGAIENLRYPTRSMRPLGVHSGMWGECEKDPRGARMATLYGNGPVKVEACYENLSTLNEFFMADASSPSVDLSMKVSLCHQARASLSFCSATRRKMPSAFR